MLICTMKKRNHNSVNIPWNTNKIHNIFPQKKLLIVAKNQLFISKKTKQNNNLGQIHQDAECHLFDGNPWQTTIAVVDYPENDR